MSSRIGKPLSEETKSKMSLARLGRKMSDETKAKIAMSIRLKNSAVKSDK